MGTYIFPPLYFCATPPHLCYFHNNSVLDANTLDSLSDEHLNGARILPVPAIPFEANGLAFIQTSSGETYIFEYNTIVYVQNAFPHGDLVEVHPMTIPSLEGDDITGQRSSESFANRARDFPGSIYVPSDHFSEIQRIAQSSDDSSNSSETQPLIPDLIQFDQLPLAEETPPVKTVSQSDKEYTDLYRQFLVNLYQLPTQLPESIFIMGKQVQIITEENARLFISQKAQIFYSPLLQIYVPSGYKGKIFLFQIAEDKVFASYFEKIDFDFSTI